MQLQLVVEDLVLLLMVKKGLKNILWEPMSISREQGETINECKKLQRDVNFKENEHYHLEYL